MTVSLHTLLAEEGFAALIPRLHRDISLADLANKSYPDLLSCLRVLGIEKLGHRQRIANAVSRAAKRDREAHVSQVELQMRLPLPSSKGSTIDPASVPKLMRDLTTKLGGKRRGGVDFSFAQITVHTMAQLLVHRHRKSMSIMVLYGAAVGAQAQQVNEQYGAVWSSPK